MMVKTDGSLRCCRDGDGSLRSTESLQLARGFCGKWRSGRTGWWRVSLECVREWVWEWRRGFWKRDVEGYRWRKVLWIFVGEKTANVGAILAWTGKGVEEPYDWEHGGQLERAPTSRERRESLKRNVDACD